MSVVKQYYGFKEWMREKLKSVLWEAEKMADKGKEISGLWISDWKKYASRHKKSHLKNENLFSKTILTRNNVSSYLKPS